jgi:DNA-binding NtrC family response regulator
MTTRTSTLLTWHSANHGIEVLKSAIILLAKRRVNIGKVLYLVQRRAKGEVLSKLDNAVIERMVLDINDPTDHADIYAAVRDNVIPAIRDIEDLHINVSPGTPAMHAVWLILHAGGAFPIGTQLWSSQFDPERKERRISPVRFEISSYLAEVRRGRALRPCVAQYEIEAKSDARREALGRLGVYAKVPGAPLLILGERGTGKTRLVETVVGEVRGKKVLSVACGGLDTNLAESALFGHVRGAFTGAEKERAGLIAAAKGKILFLDEVQDLPRPVQRKLVRVLQDRQRKYSPVGSDEERCSEFEVVCASNHSLMELQDRLDADLFDRLAHLVVTIPPLRECRDDIRDDWCKVWAELRVDTSIDSEAPWNNALEKTLADDPLAGNFRDLQRLALLCLAWDVPAKGAKAVNTAMDEWRASRSAPASIGTSRYYHGTREERTRAFQKELAAWAKQRFGTWTKAANALHCNEKTLRDDAAGA